MKYLNPFWWIGGVAGLAYILIEWAIAGLVDGFQSIIREEP